MDYFLRCTQSDWPELLNLGVTLGILRITETGDHYGDGWDFIGSVYRATGETVSDPETGQPIDLTAPVLAPDGLPYVHANLRLSFDLRDLASSSDDPAVLAALGNLSRFFVVDESGAPKRPAVPVRVFF